MFILIYFRAVMDEAAYMNSIFLDVAEAVSYIIKHSREEHERTPDLDHSYYVEWQDYGPTAPHETLCYVKNGKLLDRDFDPLPDEAVAGEIEKMVQAHKEHMRMLQRQGQLAAAAAEGVERLVEQTHASA